MATARKRPQTRQETILSRMSRMDETPVERKFIGQIVALPGAGKSILAMRLAQRLRGDGQVLYVDARQGWVSLEEFPELQEEVIYSGSFFPAEDLMGMADMLVESRTTRGPLEGVSVVVLDEFTTWYKDILEDVVRGRTGAKPDDMLPEIAGRDHSPVEAMMAAVFAKLMKAPDVHIICVAHAREKVETVQGGGSRTLYSPNYPPLMGVNMSTNFHSSVFLKRKIDGKGKAVRSIQAHPTALIQAKNRIPGMPEAEITPEAYVDRVVAWAEQAHYDKKTGEVLDDTDPELLETEEQA